MGTEKSNIPKPRLVGRNLPFQDFHGFQKHQPTAAVYHKRRADHRIIKSKFLQTIEKEQEKEIRISNKTSKINNQL